MKKMSLKIKNKVSSILFFLTFLSSFSCFADVVKSNEITLNSDQLKLVNAESFEKLLNAFNQRGLDKIVFEKVNTGFQNTSLTNVGSMGDLFVLMSFPGENDTNLRVDNYNYLYRTIENMTDLNFRVILNLHAGIEDLREALQNKNPTIIMWNSHGGKDGFYSYYGPKNDNTYSTLVPYNIFKNASPTVYQFILFACYGDESFKYYQPSVPKSLTYFRWSGEIYSSTFGSFLSKEFDPFSNRNFSNGKFTCRGGGDKYNIETLDGETLPGTTTMSKNTCYNFVSNIKNGFICSKTDENKYDTYSIYKMKKTIGNSFNTEQECLGRIKTSSKNRICRGGNKNDKVFFSLVNSLTNQTEKDTYENLNQCISSLTSTREI